MNKKRKILWGGATASSQYEGGYNLGGKGLDTQDCRPYLMKQNHVKKLVIIHSAKDQMAIITLMKIFSY